MLHARRLAGTVLAAGVAAASLAACGSSSPSSTASAPAPPATSSSTTTSSTTSAAKTPIKVGQIIALSGPLTFPDIAGAVKASVRAVNAAGGVGGHQIDLVQCDEANNPNSAVACAHKLVSDSVVAEIGGQSVTAETQIAAVLGAAKIPQIGDDPSGGAFHSLTSEFLTYEPDVTIQAVGALKECAKQGYTKIGNPNLEVPTTTAIAAVVDKAAAKLGVKVVSAPQVPLTQTDYAPIAQSMISAGVQCIDPEIPPTGIIGLLRAYHSLGQKVQLDLNSGILRPADVKSLGALGDGTVIISSYPVPTDAAKYSVFTQFQAAMKLDAAGGAPYNQADASSAAINGYFAVQAFAKTMGSVLQSGGSPTAAALLTALRAAKAVDLGLPTPWNPNSPGPAWGTRVWNGVVYGHLVDKGLETDLGSPLDVLSLAGGQ